MNRQKIDRKILPIFRTRRMKLFVKWLKPTGETRVLDVGGTEFNWRLIDFNFQVTLLNLTQPENPAVQDPRFHYIVGDGTNLQYPDQAFDICYSNSVIEHLGTYANQEKFASEVSRVARSIWIQTPARSFFFEPHFLSPFFHFFPKSWQKRLARFFTPWGWLTNPSGQDVDSFVEEIRLITYQEMTQLFPDCRIYVERFLGMPKAFIAVRVG